MAQAIYLTDPAVAAAYHVYQGEWASVTDEAEAAWLIANHHGYPIDAQRAMPAPGFVHPDAPLPFVPYAGPAPPVDRPSTVTVTITPGAPGVFDVTFGGVADTAEATGHFTIQDDTSATLADVTYTQPAATTLSGSAAALNTALAPHAPPLVLTKVGAVLTITGTNPPTVASVVGTLTVPAAPVAARRPILRRRSP